MRSLCYVVVVLSGCYLLAGCEHDSGKPKKATSLAPRVGDPAPDIVGEDLDGLGLKLSDFKGKVVLLDFWATWCPTCVRFLPHGKQLTQMYKGRPFVVLGVNNDDMEKMPKAGDLSMKCWADGRGGPITRRWGIEAFPTMFIIDHEGIVRRKFEWPGPAEVASMDETIENLVKKAEGK